MAFWCIFFMRVLMLGFGILRLVNLLIECLCIAPLTPVVIVMIEGRSNRHLIHVGLLRRPKLLLLLLLL